MAEQGRGGLLRRAARALVGGAEEARRAAVERTSAKYPDAYPPGFTARDDEERDER